MEVREAFHGSRLQGLGQFTGAYFGRPLAFHPKARWRIGSPAVFLGLKPKDIGEVLKKARIQRDESGAWVADSEAIPGCIGQGVTKRKAITNLREAIETQLWLSGKSGSAFQRRQAKITKRLMTQLGRCIDSLKIPATAPNKRTE